MAKDQSYQVSSQNSENKGNFMNENPNGGYPSAKLHRKREGPRFAQAFKKARPKNPQLKWILFYDLLPDNHNRQGL